MYDCHISFGRRQNYKEVKSGGAVNVLIAKPDDPSFIPGTSVDSLWKSALSVYYTDPWIWTQVLSLVASAFTHWAISLAAGLL